MMLMRLPRQSVTANAAIAAAAAAVAAAAASAAAGLLRSEELAQCFEYMQHRVYAAVGEGVQLLLQ